jgi:hypothetical protein
MTGNVFIHRMARCLEPRALRIGFTDRAHRKTVKRFHVRRLMAEYCLVSSDDVVSIKMSRRPTSSECAT